MRRRPPLPPAPTDWLPDIGDRVRHRFVHNVHGEVMDVRRADGITLKWFALVVLDRLDAADLAIESLVPAEWYHRAWLREIVGFRFARRWLDARRARRVVRRAIARSRT